MFGAGFPFVILCPLTTSRRGLSLHAEIERRSENGLDESSYVQCERVRSVNRRRLVHRLGTIDARTAAAVGQVIRTLLDL
jgi:mRNA interferase MazF